MSDRQDSDAAAEATGSKILETKGTEEKIDNDEKTVAEPHSQETISS